MYYCNYIRLIKNKHRVKLVLNYIGTIKREEIVVNAVINIHILATWQSC